MAVQALASKFVGTQVWLVTWAACANGDTGSPYELVDTNDNCFTVDGTFGTGGSVTLEGSNDGTHYYALHDPLGNAITLTAAGIKQILETPRYVRPNVTAGDGTTALVPIIRARRGSR
jgi:hypothetical protein